MSRVRGLKKAFEGGQDLNPIITHSGTGGAQSQDVILYVIDIQDHMFRLDIHKGTFNEGDKRVTTLIRQLNVFNVLRVNEVAPDFIGSIDIDILSRLATRGLIKGQNPFNLDVPKLLRQNQNMDIGLVRDLCETGRLLSAPRAENVIYWSDEVRQADVGWVVTPEGEHRLKFFPEEIGSFRIIQLEGQGLWLNASGGAIGALEICPTAEFIRLVEESPQFSQEERAEVDQLFHMRRWRTPVADRHTGDLAVRPPRQRRVRLRLYGLNSHRGRYWEKDRKVVMLPALRMRFAYEGVEVQPFDGVKPVIKDEQGETILERDTEWEAACLNRLHEAGAVTIDLVKNHVVSGSPHRQDLVFEPIIRTEKTQNTSDLGRAIEFVFRTLPKLQAEGWEVEMIPSWPIREEKKTSRLIVETVKSQGEDFAGHGWFDLGFFVEIAGKRFNLVPLITAFMDQVARDHPIAELLERGRLRELLEERPVHVDQGDGFYGAVDLSPIADAVHLFLKSSFRDTKLHPAESAFAAEVEEALAGSSVEFSDHAGILPLGRSLTALFRSPAAETPVGVRAQLRPYQSFGAAWMGSVNAAGFGGLLADDMGLGKTLQILTLLQARRERGLALGPALLIVPTSLLHGWQEQAADFTPDLRLLILHGSDRGRRYDKVAQADLVVTTYQLLTNDLPFLRRRNWDILIVDEAQNLKNPDSQASRSLRKVPAAGRLALTGTPMENSLKDLWSLFDWLNPGLLGDRKTFKTLFQTPIEKRGDTEAQARLNRRVSPFLLRRTKDAVAADLPPRTEILDEVILDTAQQALYESVRSAMDKRVRDAISARGLAGSQITILDALLKLRQVCCDPALVKSDEARAVRRSAKRERLLELLKELAAEGRRVLVFSQFVEMLNLIKGDLDQLGIDHVVLTGKTLNRGKVIQGFKEGVAPVFLISLKAGGVGLNLTEADTVILYDPWWNPAVESQAMDRVHRIGQDKPVFIHRLVAAGTVEERILALQDRKRALADALLKEGSNDHAAKLIDEEALADLFAPLRR